MWELLGGMGKSRIIATMSLMMLTHSQINKVHIVVPIPALMERDKKEFAQYFTLSSMQDCVEFHC